MPTPGVRIDVGVAAKAGDRRRRQVIGEILRRRLVDGVPADVALGDRKVDRQPWDLDPVTRPGSVSGGPASAVAAEVEFRRD
jgi:hypothetical protein